MLLWMVNAVNRHTTVFPPACPPQVVPSDSQENGQGDEVVEKSEQEKQRRTSKDKRKNSLSEEASETHVSVTLDGEAKKGELVCL